MSAAAAANGLAVGDRITLQLGDKLFEQFAARVP
jgi:hypothetical protein